MTSQIPIACVPAAIPAEERVEWQRLMREVLGQALEVGPLEGGFAIRLPDDSLVLAARYISYERRCCPFLSWTIAIDPAGGPLWLRMEGPDGTRDFLRANFETLDLLPRVVAQAAGLDVAL